MSGVPVTRTQRQGFQITEKLPWEVPSDEPGQWFPEPVASRLIDPADRDNEWCEAITAEIPWEVDGDGDPMSIVADAVGSLREQRDARIDPDDPQVRERIVRLLHGDTGHAIADDLISAPIFDYADAILAALKMGAPDA